MGSARIGKVLAWIPVGERWELGQVEAFVGACGEVDRAYWMGLSPEGREVYERCLPWSEAVRVAAERAASAERDPVGFATCRVVASGSVQAFWQWSARAAGGSVPGLDRARSEFLSAARGWRARRRLAPGGAAVLARLFGSRVGGVDDLDG